jgi:hypothetical protein
MKRAVCELKDNTPYGEEIAANYDPSKECIQEHNYIQDLRLRKMKRCL